MLVAMVSPTRGSTSREVCIGALGVVAGGQRPGAGAARARRRRASVAGRGIYLTLPYLTLPYLQHRESKTLSNAPTQTSRVAACRPPSRRHHRYQHVLDDARVDEGVAYTETVHRLLWSLADVNWVEWRRTTSESVSATSPLSFGERRPPACPGAGAERGWAHFE